MITKITYTKKALPFVLKAFGKVIDGAGYIADSITGEIITDRFGTQLTEDNFGGVHKGEYIANDLWSIMNLIN
jgi:hypothetical protein